MRSLLRVALPVVLVLSFGTACAPRGARGGSTTIVTTGGDRGGGRRTGVPADTRSRSGRGESPPGHDGNHGGGNGQGNGGQGNGRGNGRGPR